MKNTVEKEELLLKKAKKLEGEVRYSGAVSASEKVREKSGGFFRSVGMQITGGVLAAVIAVGGTLGAMRFISLRAGGNVGSTDGVDSGYNELNTDVYEVDVTTGSGDIVADETAVLDPGSVLLVNGGNYYNLFNDDNKRVEIDYSEDFSIITSSDMSFVYAKINRMDMNAASRVINLDGSSEAELLRMITALPGGEYDVELSYNQTVGNNILTFEMIRGSFTVKKQQQGYNGGVFIEVPSDKTPAQLHGQAGLVVRSNGVYAAPDEFVWWGGVYKNGDFVKYTETDDGVFAAMENGYKPARLEYASDFGIAVTSPVGVNIVRASIVKDGKTEKTVQISELPGALADLDEGEYIILISADVTKYGDDGYTTVRYTHYPVKLVKNATQQHGELLTEKDGIWLNSDYNRLLVNIENDGMALEPEKITVSKKNR